MRVFIFLLAAMFLTTGTLVARASAETVDTDAAPQVEQQQKDLPEAAKRKRKLYA